jgi:hypothetical protein
MAIYSAVPPPPEYGAAGTTTNHASDNVSQHPQAQQAVADPAAGAIDIEAWTISALQSLSVSPATRGSGAPLSIPLDENPAGSKKAVAINDPRVRAKTVTPPPRPPSRRDSQRRREALLKGKEGSRQRRRWENGMVLLCVARPPRLVLCI